MESEMAAVLQSGTGTVIAVVGVVLSIIGLVFTYLFHLLIKQIKRDAFLINMGLIHKEFWETKDCKTVRSWVACDQAWEEVKPTLVKRLADLEESTRANPKGTTSHATTLTLDDYKKLEMLDRFCNTLFRVERTDPDFNEHRRAYRQLFLKYWLEQALSREQLNLYMLRFYGPLLQGCDNNLLEQYRGRWPALGIPDNPFEVSV